MILTDRMIKLIFFAALIRAKCLSRKGIHEREWSKSRKGIQATARKDILIRSRKGIQATALSRKGKMIARLCHTEGDKPEVSQHT